MFDNDFDVGSTYDGRCVVVITARLGKLPPWRRTSDQALCGVVWCAPWLPWFDHAGEDGFDGLAVGGVTDGRFCWLRLGDNAGKSSFIGDRALWVVGVNWAAFKWLLSPDVCGNVGRIFCCGNEAAIDGWTFDRPGGFPDDTAFGLTGRTVVDSWGEFREKKLRIPLKNPVDFGVVVTLLSIVVNE